MTEYRSEQDSLGEVRVPASALYGAQTQRAMDNFRIDCRPMPPRFIRALALLKGAAAGANGGLGALPPEIAGALQQAAAEIAGGACADQFPVPVLQTGSGTSSNMNMNEVLATLASRSSGHPVHPNDHANCSQSSNDIIPSALQVATALALAEQVQPALATLVAAVDARAAELAGEAKTGRTHLMDAMPLTLGQELGAWARQLAEGGQRLAELAPRLLALPLGGSAVGTGVNVPAGYPQAAVTALSATTGLPFTVAASPFSRMAGQEVALECSAALRGLAVTLTKINNDLRWMASGPLAGLGEITLEALQPGSSIMPGKVNPVLPEAVLMACADVQGNDTSIALAAQSGSFQLNVMLPLIADKLLASCGLLRGACEATERSVRGFSVNREALQRPLASNPILVTALNRRIGYEAAARIAKRCYAEGRPVLEVAAEETGIDREELAQLLDPLTLTHNDNNP